MLFTRVSKQQESGSTKRGNHTSMAIRLLAALAIAAMIPMTARADDRQGRADKETFTVDVALNGATLIVNHVDPTQPANMAFPGDTLVVVGTIYRGGTLPSGIANNDPSAPSGIGKIRCRALVLAPVTDFKKKD